MNYELRTINYDSFIVRYILYEPSQQLSGIFQKNLRETAFPRLATEGHREH